MARHGHTKSYILSIPVEDKFPFTTTKKKNPILIPSGFVPKSVLVRDTL